MQLCGFPPQATAKSCDCDPDAITGHSAKFAELNDLDASAEKKPARAEEDSEGVCRRKLREERRMHRRVEVVQGHDATRPEPSPYLELCRARPEQSGAEKYAVLREDAHELGHAIVRRVPPRDLRCSSHDWVLTVALLLWVCCGHAPLIGTTSDKESLGRP